MPASFCGQTGSAGTEAGSSLLTILGQARIVIGQSLSLSLLISPWILSLCLRAGVVPGWNSQAASNTSTGAAILGHDILFF